MLCDQSSYWISNFSNCYYDLEDWQMFLDLCLSCYLNFALNCQKIVLVIIFAAHFFALFEDLMFTFDDFQISVCETAILYDFSNSVPKEFFKYCFRNKFRLERCFLAELLKANFKQDFEQEMLQKVMVYFEAKGADCLH